MTEVDALMQSLIPVSQTSQVFSSVAFVAAALGLLLLVVLHVAKPDLAPSWHMVSEYAIGRHGWLMTACFALLAISCVALALSLFPQASGWLVWVGLAFLLVTACGYGLAALFPTDPISVSPDNASGAAKLHALAFAIGVPSFIVASQLTTFGFGSNGLWDGTRLAQFGFAHLNWIGLGIMVAIIAIALPRAGGFGPGVLVGWPNRLMFLSYFGWIMTTAWPMARLAWPRG